MGRNKLRQFSFLCIVLFLAQSCIAFANCLSQILAHIQQKEPITVGQLQVSSLGETLQDVLELIQATYDMGGGKTPAPSHFYLLSKAQHHDEVIRALAQVLHVPAENGLTLSLPSTPFKISTLWRFLVRKETVDSIQKMPDGPVMVLVKGAEVIGKTVVADLRILHQVHESILHPMQDGTFPIKRPIYIIWTLDKGKMDTTTLTKARSNIGTAVSTGGKAGDFGSYSFIDIESP